MTLGRTVAAVALLAGALGCEPVLLLPSSPNPALITEADRVCADAADCMIVQADCCSCSGNGGNTGNTAVARSATGTIGDRFESCSGLCDQAISTSDTCCAEGVDCIDGRCELIGPPGRQLAIDDTCVDRAEGF